MTVPAKTSSIPTSRRALVVGGWTPNNALSQDPPAKTDVVIVGAGYGGLSTSLELRRNGVGAVVLERGDFGIGASTRNGGMISGGINIGKGLGGKSQAAEEFEAKKAALPGRRRRFAHRAGRHHRPREDRVRPAQERPLRRRLDAQALRRAGDQGRDVQQVRQCRRRDGAARAPARVHRLGLLLRRHVRHARSGHLHPALYYKGLLEAAHRAGAILCANVEAERIEKTAQRLARADAPRGRSRPSEVVVATNGYTGDLTPRLKRRVVPVASHIIATEELPEHASKLDPRAARRSATPSAC